MINQDTMEWSSGDVILDREYPLLTGDLDTCQDDQITLSELGVLLCSPYFTEQLANL